MLTINANGSKWAGQEQDSITVLLERLATNTLDPRFEDYGNFIMPARMTRRTVDAHTGEELIEDAGPLYPGAPDAVRFWGNFYDVSAVFSVDTDEGFIIEKLTAAIRANQASEAYARAKVDRQKQAALRKAGR